LGIEKLLKMLAVVVLAFGLSLIVNAQPVLELTGSVFLSAFPNDTTEVIMGLHEPSGTFQTLITEIPTFLSMACAPDNNLYFSTLERVEDGLSIKQVWRFGIDGVEPVKVHEFTRANAFMSKMLFTEAGDLYFSTFFNSFESDRGVFRILNFLDAVNGEVPFTEPELLVGTDQFTAFDDIFNSGGVQAFLTTGPFAGDLLITDSPNQSFTEGGRVMRAVAPDFNELVEFIPPFRDTRGGPLQPTGIAVNQDGNVFVADFSNGEIVEFDDEGKRVKRFAELPRANQLAIGVDDRLYATNTGFSAFGVGGGRLTIWNTNSGTKLADLGFDKTFFKLAVCNADFDFPITDSDGDGVADEDDLCPDFAGRPETSGC
jgi:hypothetical protein